MAGTEWAHEVEAVASMTAPTASTDSSFVAFMSAHQARLQRTAYLLTGGDQTAAEDVVADTLARLYVAWDRLDHVENMQAYARKVLVNAHRASLRRPWRRRESPTWVLPERAAGRGASRDDELWAAVSGLPTRQRLVIVLRYYEELTEAETAGVLGVSVGTVKSQSHKALRTLRSVVDHPSEEER